MNDFEDRLSSTLHRVTAHAPGALGLEAAARTRHRRRRQARLASIAVVAAAAIPALGVALGPASREPAPISTPTATASPTSSETHAPASVGERRQSDLGAITVHDVEFPVRAESTGVAAARGHAFGVIDLEVCSNGAPVPADAPGRYFRGDFWVTEAWIGSYSEGPMHVSVGNSTDAAVREPSLTDRELAEVAPGGCERGWVTFELPRGTEVAAVSYNPFGGTPLSWRTR